MHADRDEHTGCSGVRNIIPESPYVHRYGGGRRHTSSQHCDEHLDGDEHRGLGGSGADAGGDVRIGRRRSGCTADATGATGVRRSGYGAAKRSIRPAEHR